MMVFGDVTRGIKDGALGLSLKAFLNERFSEYGEATECKVNTREGRVSLTAMMRGERDAVTAILERYDLEEQSGEHYIVLRKISSSRPWLTSLLTRLFTGKRYKLPAAISRLF